MNMKIGNMRVLNIKVVDENNKDISYYEGMVEDAPAEIKEKEPLGEGPDEGGIKEESRPQNVVGFQVIQFINKAGRRL